MQEKVCIKHILFRLKWQLTNVLNAQRISRTKYLTRDLSALHVVVKSFLNQGQKLKRLKQSKFKMENKEDKIREMQMLEQSFQNLLMQKQAFQMELSETEAALKEIEKSGDEVFKIISQLMIKTEKKKIEEELENKKKILELRMKTILKQESSLTDQLDKLQKEAMKSMEK